jgi:hypothetical protein
MDAWAWEQLEPWQDLRTCLPVGSFFGSGTLTQSRWRAKAFRS